MPTKNIVSDYGAVANADYATAVLTTSGGSNKNLASTTAIFGTAVAGMTIRVGGAGTGTAPNIETLVDTIASVTDSQHVVLTNGPNNALSAASHQISWGTDNTAAILAFNAEFNGSSADLVFPAGKYMVRSPNTALGKGLRSCLMTGVGATLIGGIEFGAGYAAFPYGTDGLGAPLYALTQQVNRGAQSAMLVDASKTSLFPVGRKVLLGSCGLQGPNSHPSNLFFFQYLEVSAASAGLISFTEAVTDTHLTTYPQLTTGSAFLANLGGPATLYQLPEFFESSIHYKGFTFLPDEGRGMNVAGWDLWFEDITCPGTAAFSTTALWRGRFTNCNLSLAHWEMDKLIDKVTLDGGTNVELIQCASASPNLLVIDSATVDSLVGTPKRLVANGLTTDSLQVGVQGYGRTDSVQISNSSIGAFGTTQSVSDTESTYTVSGGVVSKVLANEPPHWYIPWTYLTFSGSFESQGMFRVASTTSDGTNFNIGTNMAGGWPPILGSSPIVKVHPCPVLTLENCTGCAEVVDFSQPGARGRAVMSYSKRSYTGSSQNPSGPKLWGYPTRIEIIVSVAHVGAALTIHTFGAGIAKATENGVITTWNPRVNGNIAGTRTWTLSGGWTGVQTGDVLANPPAALWLAGSQAPYLATDVSGDAPMAFSVEIASNQEVTSQFVAPLRLRLRA